MDTKLEEEHTWCGNPGFIAAPEAPLGGEFSEMKNINANSFTVHKKHDVDISNTYLSTHVTSTRLSIFLGRFKIGVNQ